jgi:cell division protein ZapA
MKPNRVEANIFGSDYTITGDASEEYIRSITLYVDKKMRELAKVFPKASSEKLAVLVAINITDELFQHKENIHATTEEMTQAYDEKAKKLISMIDQRLIGD